MPETPEHTKSVPPNPQELDDKQRQGQAAIIKDMSLIEKEQAKIEETQLNIAKLQFYTSALFNFFLVISSVALSYLTYNLEKSTDLMRISAEDQSRPYVFPTSIFKTDDSNEAFVTIKNVGLTPAYHMLVQGEAFIQPIINGGLDIEVGFDPGCKPNPSIKSPAFPTSLGSNEEETQFLPPVIVPENFSDPTVVVPTMIDSFSKEQLGDVAAGKSAYVIDGEICYSNVHGDRYYTRYCKFFAAPAFYELGPRIKAQQELVTDGSPCTQFNDAD